MHLFSKRTLMLGLLALLLTVPLLAQDARWSAWLYSTGSARLTLVSDSGEQDWLNPPLPDGYDVPPATVAVAPNGSTMAYVASSSSSSEVMLAIFDYNLRAITATFPPPRPLYQGLDIAPRFAFSADSSVMAFGYSTTDDTWEIVLIDVTVPEILATLRSSDPIANLLPSGFGLTPAVLSVARDRVGFAIFPGGTDARPPFEGFIWQVDSGRVQPSLAYASPDMDRFAPTGEIVYGMLDTRLPDNSDAFMFGQDNTLQVYDPAIDARYPFLHTLEYSVYGPRFVQNGAYVIAGHFREPGPLWLILERDGTVFSGLPEPSGPESIAGTVDGLLFTRTDPEFNRPQLMEVDSIRSEGVGMVPRWTGDPADGFTQIAWVGAFEGSYFSQADYMPWAQLAEPVRAGDLVATETPDSGGGTDGAPPVAAVTATPVVPVVVDEVLRVGGAATVNTTEGDSLNLRSDAGIAFRINARLPRGTVVTLLDGPVEADGYRWWRVRTPEGTEGWVVDQADTVITLVPGRSTASPGGEIDERQEGSADPTLESALIVGEDAIVTLARRGDVLRMRNAPGLDAEIIALLPNGSQLRVVDGPSALDGYLWWQLRTPEGRVGWAAEIVGRDRTLTLAAAARATSTPPPASNAQLRPPAQILPVPGTTRTGLPADVIFDWQAVEGAAQYTLEVQRCTDTCREYQRLTTAALELPLNFTEAGTYRWRVFALRGSGEVGIPSEWWAFSLVE